MNSNTLEYKKHALTAYQQSYRNLNYGIINDWLRTHNVEDKSDELHALAKSRDSLMRRLATVIQTIDQTVHQSRGHKKLHAFRGISQKRYQSALSMGTLVNKAYTSTSLELEHAKKFGTVILRFTIPPEIGAHVMENQYEAEVLIERNTQFVSFEEKGTHDGALLVDCTLAKYTPPSIKDLQNMKDMVSKHRQEFMSKLDELDEDIDWDNL